VPIARGVERLVAAVDDLDRARIAWLSTWTTSPAVKSSPWSSVVTRKGAGVKSATST
jgi:hypothetical protein